MAANLGQIFDTSPTFPIRDQHVVSPLSLASRVLPIGLECSRLASNMFVDPGISLVRRVVWPIRDIPVGVSDFEVALLGQLSPIALPYRLLAMFESTLEQSAVSTESTPLD